MTVAGSPVSAFPTDNYARGPNYGVGRPIDTPWRDSPFTGGYAIFVPANYGDEGNRPNYGGLKTTSATGQTGAATAMIESVGVAPYAQDTYNPYQKNYSVVPYGVSWQARVAAPEAGAVYSGQSITAVYGRQVTFNVAEPASLASTLY